MSKKILLLNISDAENSTFRNEAQQFLINNNVECILCAYKDLRKEVFTKTVISKIILYIDLTDTSESDLMTRLMNLSMLYSPFMNHVYILNNDLDQVSEALKRCFLLSNIIRQKEMFNILSATFEDEMLVTMEEDDLLPIWQNMLNNNFLVNPEEIEKISSDLGSIFMRALLLMKKGKRDASFKLFKSLYITNKQFVPVLEYLKEFEDFKDQLPNDFYLNYKLFNKIKQGKANYLELYENEKKKKARTHVDFGHHGKSMKEYLLNYKNLDDLRKRIEDLPKISLDEMRELNDMANELSRLGKCDDAVLMYKKVYNCLEASKRPKMLLNIAIAYKRGEEWRKCIFYANKLNKKDPKGIELITYCRKKIGSKKDDPK